MKSIIGFDIGGTKIAGGVFEKDGAMLAELVVPTQHNYELFLASIAEMVHNLESKTNRENCPVGIGIAGRIARDGELGDSSPNMIFLQGKLLKQDLEIRLGRSVRLANDANCMTLAEAMDGAGAGYESVYGVTLGTGIGGGFVFQGKIIEGANGLAGELSHLPLPYREDDDGPVVECGCGQTGCIEKSLCGAALARLYSFMTGKEADAKTVNDMAQSGDAEALRVLDRYFEVFAKAMVGVIHAFDPDVIVAGGSMITLPGLFEEVPKRWGKFAYMPSLGTKFVPAKHGSRSGMRGAAWLWR